MVDHTDIIKETKVPHKEFKLNGISVEKPTKGDFHLYWPTFTFVFDIERHTDLHVTVLMIPSFRK